MPRYQVELDNGKKFEVEADSQPSEEDVLRAIQGQSAPATTTSSSAPVTAPPPPRFQYSPMNYPNTPPSLPEKIGMGVGRFVNRNALPIIGQMAGDAIGAPAGPAGMIPAGAAGAGIGEELQIAREKWLQGKEVSPAEELSRLKWAVAGGAAGEAAAPLVSAAAPAVSRALEPLSNAASGALKTITHFFAGVPEESTQRLLEKGADNVLTKENMAPDALLDIGKKLNTMLSSIREDAEQKFWDVVAPMKRDAATKIGTGDLSQFLTEKLSDLGIVDPQAKTLAPGVFGQSQGERLLRQIYSKVTGPSERDTLINALQKDPFGAIPEDKIRGAIAAMQPSGKGMPETTISAKDAFNWVRKLDDSVKYAKAGQLQISGQEEAVIKQFRGLLMQKLENTYGDPLRNANKEFSGVAQLYDQLAPKLSLESVESTLRGLNSPTAKDLTRQQLEQMVQMGGEDGANHLEKLKDVLAARDFSESTFRGIRAGILRGGLLALAHPMGIPASALAIPSIAAGVTLSTPSAMGGVIRLTQGLGKAYEMAVQKGLLGSGLPATKAAVGTAVKNLRKK